MNFRSAGIFLICIGASLLVGFWGSSSTVPSITGWYATLTKPFWTPPNWVFMPVWTLLYILMGSAMALVWTSSKKGKVLPVAFFLAHLMVNLYWSIAFFGNHDLVVALATIIVLLLMIVGMMVWYWRYSRVATYLLVPYLLWVSYATSLNLGIIMLNP
ncbi:MAG: TspO/MBR family protein [Patescibacteria group bacterium]|jgi:tryptophan-rich sensory protein